MGNFQIVILKLPLGFGFKFWLLLQPQSVSSISSALRNWHKPQATTFCLAFHVHALNY